MNYKQNTLHQIITGFISYILYNDTIFIKRYLKEHLRLSKTNDPKKFHLKTKLWSRNETYTSNSF